MKLFILNVLFLLLIVSSLEAAWVDDWLAQKTVTNASSFEGQKRNYLSGGSFSARWNTGNDYLVSAQLPRIKSGCGGIDMFAGALSFMNVDRLVQKLQAMVSNAPAVAFDLAFNVLCEPCAKAVKSFEAITDSLNNLQFNDCRASKLMVAKMYSAAGGENSKIRADAESEFALQTGINDLRQDLKDTWNSSGGQPTVNDSAQIDACPADLRDIYGTPGTTVLEAIAVKRGYPSTYVDLARGFVGDVGVTLGTSPNGSTQINAYPIKRCKENKPESIDNFFTGEIYIRPSDGGNCTLTTDANANLIQWASTQLQEISNKMASKTPLSAGDNTFIDSIPLPVYATLKFSIVTGQTASTIATLADLTARAYAYSMMTDMYQAVTTSLNTASDIVSKKTPATSTRCQVSLFNSAIKKSEELSKGIHRSLAGLKKSYYGKATEINGLGSIAKRYEEFTNTARATLGETFAPSFVNMAVGGS